MAGMGRMKGILPTLDRHSGDPTTVIPAKAGIYGLWYRYFNGGLRRQIPAFAGMTVKGDAGMMVKGDAGMMVKGDAGMTVRRPVWRRGL